MDFALIERRETDNICYKLLKAYFYRNYYVIIAQDKKEFYCGCIRASREEAINLFTEIAESHTDIYCVGDILSDFSKQRV